MDSTEWVLVTGGAGFIGTNTIVRLIESGYKVVCLDNFSFCLSNSLDCVRSLIKDQDALRFYAVDVRNAKEMNRVFKEQHFSSVIHFAALKSVSESIANPIEYYDNNVLGTTVLLKTMLNHNVKRIVFSSSATVYGPNNISPLVETMSDLNPSNPYGRTKLQIEQMLQDICASDLDFQALILRYFNPIGAHSSGLLGDNPSGFPNNLMPFILQVASGRRPKLNVFGNDYPTQDGTAERDYIHVTDVAEGHVSALRFQKPRGAHIFNLGTGKPVSVLQLINQFVQTTKVEINFIVVDRRPGDVACVYSDPTKAQTVLGWKATKTLADMCKDAYSSK